MRRSLWPGLALGLVLAGGAARADVWDVGADTDNSIGTDNELTHGTVQVHDLGALPGPVTDQDWYRLYIPRHTSWEVLVDGTTGDICAGGGAGLDLMLFESDGVTPAWSSHGVSSFQCTRSINVFSTVIDSNPPHTYVRVLPIDCTTNCDINDQYTIHARETTLYVPRFNNSATQVTVCIVQNGDDVDAADAVFAFFNASGVVIGGTTVVIPARGTVVVNSASLPGLAGQSGSVMIEHSGRYGRMQGKCVALEPATGFTFDTQAATRPY